MALAQEKKAEFTCVSYFLILERLYNGKVIRLRDILSLPIFKDVFSITPEVKGSSSSIYTVHGRYCYKFILSSTELFL